MFLRYLLVFTLITSCRSTKVVQKKQTVTSFTADTSIFNNENNPILYYNDLQGITVVSRTLRLNQRVSLFIERPTNFECNGFRSIIYPGDDVIISQNANGEIIFTVVANEERNNEIIFQSNLEKIRKSISPSFPARTQVYPLDSVLNFETKLKIEIPNYINRLDSIFDSLVAISHISKQSYLLNRAVINNSSYSQLFYLYQVYKQTFKDNNLYEKKLRSLWSFNKISDKNELIVGASFYLEDIAGGLLRKKFREIKTGYELTEAIDSINNNFKGLSRDFLLSKLFYTAIYKRVPISKKNLNYFYRSCEDEGYKFIVKTFNSERVNFLAKSKKKRENRLISLVNSNLFTIEEVIQQQRGKLVLLDLWASWCIPCLEQIPNMKKLEQHFSNDEISFIYLSMDKEILQWRYMSEDQGIDPSYSFLFENFEKQPFLRIHKIEEIPRYILIDKNGQIINANAPGPDDPALKSLIEQHLYNL